MLIFIDMQTDQFNYDYKGSHVAFPAPAFLKAKSPEPSAHSTIDVLHC